MGQALYRKYRSKTLDEIVGQEHITKTLKKALKGGRISHAYLFTGPRGVGKTSIARILAHEINGLPYDEKQTYIDIIEIDAASNRRIDEIRDLRDKVNIAPAQANYKVYIIDEVHMLTKEAFNALLKTLEEPPAHVVFILATTEAHKLPTTIISRTQRFIFRPIDRIKAVEHLRVIAKKEGLAITDAALELIAEHGDGSFRDSISLLDQAGSYGAEIDVDTVRSLLGIPPQTAIEALLDILFQPADITAVIQHLNSLYDQGFQAPSIAKQLAQTIRGQVIANTIDTQEGAALLAQLLEVPVSHDPERYLEIILLQFIASRTPKIIFARTNPSVVKRTISVEQLVKTKQTKAIEQDKEPVKPEAMMALDDANWSQVLVILKKQYNTLYGIVRMAKPDFSQGSKLTLTFAFTFHQKRAQEAKNLKAIKDAIYAVTGQVVEIDCITDTTLKPSSIPAPARVDLPPISQSPKQEEPLSAISNIFGGGELLQS